MRVWAGLTLLIILVCLSAHGEPRTVVEGGMSATHVIDHLAPGAEVIYNDTVRAEQAVWDTTDNGEWWSTDCWTWVDDEYVYGAYCSTWVATPPIAPFLTFELRTPSLYVPHPTGWGDMYVWLWYGLRFDATCFGAPWCIWNTMPDEEWSGTEREGEGIWISVPDTTCVIVSAAYDSTHAATWVLQRFNP